jgi:hypothetical protein
LVTLQRPVSYGIAQSEQDAIIDMPLPAPTNWTGQPDAYEVPFGIFEEAVSTERVSVEILSVR